VPLRPCEGGAPRAGLSGRGGVSRIVAAGHLAAGAEGNMLFSAQLPPASLVEMCHILRHSLGAGLTLRDTFRQLATRAPGRVRDVSERIRQRLERGDSLEDALKDEEKVLPPLFRAMAQVGERTGHLPQVFT